MSAKVWMLVAGPELAGDKGTGHFLWLVPSPRLACSLGAHRAGGGQKECPVFRAEETHQRTGKGEGIAGTENDSPEAP